MSYTNQRLLYLDKKSHPYHAIAEFRQPFQDCQTKITYVVGYLQKESPFLTKHLHIFL
jgi:hypothetical protein